MSAHFGLQQRRAAGDAAPTTGSVEEPGAYLTDGVFLYRITNVLMCGLGEMVEIEDCYALDVVQVPIGDLRARRLRVVRPAIGA